MPLHRRIAASVLAATLGLATGGCSAPAAEPDFGPFIDVWAADPPPRPGQPVEYLILQGDFSVCQFSVRGPADATYSGGEYTLTPKQLTLTLGHEGASRKQVYRVDAFRRGELRLTEVTPGAPEKGVVLKHTKAYSSCADVQTLFGKKLKFR